MSVIWLAALVVFLVIEGLTVGLTSIWFGAGALVSLVVSLLNGPLWLQITLFLAVSLVTMLLVRPLAQRYLNNSRTPTNADRVIGEEAVVTETIDNLQGRGQVNIAGQIWTARTEGEQPQAKGTRVLVRRIEGVKVIVAPVPTPAQQSQSQT